MTRVPTLIISGPVGVGKTTLIDEMGELLLDAGLPHALVDFDQLTQTFPRPEDDDRFGGKIGLRNLSAVWRNYRRAGARRLIIASVIESRRGLAGFRAAVPGADITVVRLRAPIKTLHSRLRRRGIDVGWHLARATELAPLLDRRKVEDLVVDTERRRPRVLAREILEKVGWLEG